MLWSTFVCQFQFLPSIAARSPGSAVIFWRQRKKSIFFSPNMLKPHRISVIAHGMNGWMADRIADEKLAGENI